MQHSTSTSHSGLAGSTMRGTSQSRPSNGKPYTDHGDTEKFPDFDVGQHVFANGRATSPRRHNGNGYGGYGYTNGTSQPSMSSDRWHARKDSRVKWAPGHRPSPSSFGHSRKQSISRAIRHIRAGSMSQNAHELAEALRAPVSYKLVVCLCLSVSAASFNEQFN